MEPANIAIINAHLEYIVLNMDTKRTLDHLLSTGTLTNAIRTRVMRITQSDDANRELLEILKKTHGVYGKFIEALHNTQQFELVKRLQTIQASSTSSADLQPCNENLQQILESAQQSLKEMYLTRFQKVRPFSLPFMFDIENTWVSLALKEEKYLQATQDHAKLLQQAFKKAKMLTIEGDPATGKTSLMRRLAYEWARQKNRSTFDRLKNWMREQFYGGIQLLYYDLVLYAEFREVREKTFESIAQLVLHYSKNCLTEEDYEKLEKLLNNEKFCKEYRILVLLDGYDESSLEKQCLELSSYISDRVIKKTLLFNTVVTTRKGYLSTHRDVKEGRLVFAEVLGFTTMTQKEKYVLNHFFSEEIDNKDKISAVNNLLASNKNLNKLAETPLFLTFICLVYEKIVHGTLLELYCNIIRWLLDRHQQDFPDRDIPTLFEYQSDCALASALTIRQKQITIQRHFLHFPQLLSLGKMALNHLKKDIFQETDFTVFSIKPIVQQVGLIRKDEFHDRSWNLKTTYSFPHRTIQEFLAAFYCFCSNDLTDKWLLPNSILDTSENEEEKGMNEYERFLLRIALSDNMPIQTKKREYYYEKITDIKLDITFDAFNTIAGFNNKLLNSFLSQCTNVKNIILRGELNTSRHRRNKNDTSVYNEPSIKSIMSSPTLFSFSDLSKLLSLEFLFCTFSANSQLLFTNCPSLKNLIFKGGAMKSSTIVGIATLPAIDIVAFYECKIDLATWQSITDQIRNSSIKYLGLSADYFLPETYPIFQHMHKCERIQQIHIRYNILKCSEDEVTANLAETAKKKPRLTSITISDEDGKLGENNKQRIEKAGQARNPEFSIKWK